MYVCMYVCMYVGPAEEGGGGGGVSPHLFEN